VVQSIADMSFVQGLEAAEPKLTSRIYGGSAAKRRVGCHVETDVIFILYPSCLSPEITASSLANPAVNVKENFEV